MESKTAFAAAAEPVEAGDAKPPHRVIHGEVRSTCLETHTLLVSGFPERSDDSSASGRVIRKAQGRQGPHCSSQPRVNDRASQRDWRYYR
jgi:hypothetical protein